MKKTLTVNLGGVVFNIDEDAYVLLEKYLSTLHLYFNREEGTDEIMSDFETRISELLTERMQAGFNVITIEHVEAVIRRMGSPEEIFNDGEKQSESTQTRQEPPAGKAKKRLMRDKDNHVLGGVASGLAAYFGCDVTAMRLLLLVLFLLPLPIPVVFIYIIMWIVTPVARTAADKLIMRGESVNLENLGKTITDCFDKVNDYISSGKPRTALQKTGDFIVSFFGALLKIGIFLAAIVLIPVLLMVTIVLLAGSVALVVGGLGSPFCQLNMLDQVPKYALVAGSFAGVMLIGIPLIALTHVFCSTYLKVTPFSPLTKWIWLLLWIVALVVSIVSGSIIFNSGDFPYMIGCGIFH